ncbi:MAG: metallophosphoesterase family protein [Eubacteriales bacterium]|nr:metallophosphoesterase family protein [Eubacteriales bacterium]
MKKIGVISDTHGKLRAGVIEHLTGCDLILHGGDINKQMILDQLAEIAPLHVVRGNNDKEWAQHLPKELYLQVEELRIYMVHNKAHIPKNLCDVDLIVFGHSHKYLEKEENGIFYLNPGSCGPRRFDQEITIAMLTIDGKEFSIEKILIDHEEKVSRRKK